MTVTSVIPAQTPDDAVPYSTSGPPPALPTGSWQVTLDEPSITTNSCLTTVNQNNAWDCSNGASLNLTIGTQNNAPYVTLTYPYKPGQIQYGAQPPQLAGASSLLFMSDTDRSAFKRGPAYVFKQPFDKTVIVRSQDFPGAVARRGLAWSVKRWLGVDYPPTIVTPPILRRQIQQSDWNMTSIASPSDKPWQCVWKGTWLSAYIYVSQSVTQPSQYPKSLKITEKRPHVNPPQAFCQQMQIQPDFSMRPLKLADGSTNLVNLQEVESDTDDDGNSPGHLQQRSLNRRQDYIGGPRCQCTWLST